MPEFGQMFGINKEMRSTGEPGENCLGRYSRPHVFTPMLLRLSAVLVRNSLNIMPLSAELFIMEFPNYLT